MRDFSLILVVLFAKFEEGTRMFAHGADFGSEFTDVDVSAVAAFPNDDVIFDEDFSGFDVG